MVAAAFHNAAVRGTASAEVLDRATRIIPKLWTYGATMAINDAVLRIMIAAVIVVEFHRRPSL